MRVSELLAQLQALMVDHGDLEVVDAYDDDITPPEEVDGKIVVADRA